MFTCNTCGQRQSWVSVNGCKSCTDVYEQWLKNLKEGDEIAYTYNGSYYFGVVQKVTRTQITIVRNAHKTSITGDQQSTIFKRDTGLEHTSGYKRRSLVEPTQQLKDKLAEKELYSITRKNFRAALDQAQKDAKYDRLSIEQMNTIMDILATTQE